MAKEYEQQYSEALAELRSRGCKVASPSTAPDGIRRVQIDDFTACIDRLVFEKAWGQLIADQVMRKNPLPTKTSLPPSRTEAVRVARIAGILDT